MLWAVGYEISGTVVGDFTSLNVTVKISALKTEVGTATGTDLLKNLYVYMPENTSPIQYSETVPTTGTWNTDFFWKDIAAPALADDTSDTTKVTLTYRIQINAAKAIPISKYKTTVDGKNAVKIKAAFVNLTSGSPVVDTGSEKAISQSFSRPADAPEGFAAAGAYKSAVVSWTNAAQAVSYTDGTTKDTPSNVLIMAFPEGSGDVTLKAKAVSNTADPTDVADGCQYQEGRVNCIDCDANQKIFIVDGQTGTGIKSFSLATNTKGSAVINDLDPEVNYTLVMQFQEGVKRTACLTVQATENVSLSEFNGEKSASLGDPRCFIASAAYGSPFAAELGAFRWARDTFLMPFRLGRAMTQYYYDHSQPLANAIKASSTYQTIARSVLWPVGLSLSALQLSFEHPFGALVTALVFGILTYLLIRWSRYSV